MFEKCTASVAEIMFDSFAFENGRYYVRNIVQFYKTVYFGFKRFRQSSRKFNRNINSMILILLPNTLMIIKIICIHNDYLQKFSILNRYCFLPF